MDRRLLLATAVALGAVLAGMWWGRGLVVRPAISVQPVAPSSSHSSPAETLNGVVVHVSGWVVEPGLVSVEDGARVGDALAAAGGARPGARLDAMNLAELVGDGQQVVVPGPADPVTTGEPASPAEGEGGVIHLNSATVADLETLPGVGPVLAERIVSHRESHGAFEQVEDLLEVSGIGEAKLASIRDLVAAP